ncbi:hypothetical protein CHUAL_000829 [Chamberlinius hualienensis]
MKISGKVSGVFVLSPALTTHTVLYSPDQACPNQRFGMYTNGSSYNGCSVQWNKYGDAMFYEDWSFPVFLVENDEDRKQLIENCYQKFNAPDHGKPRDWPLCAAELFSSMYAAKDSKTCMRRSRMTTNLNPIKVCDPIGDLNIWSLLFPTNKSVEIPDRSVVVVAARLDSFSMFGNIAPGRDSAVSGIVALLAIAETLNRVFNSSVSDKNVLFLLFNAEAFDYIGSSRVVYDMQNSAFPAVLNDDILSQPSLISLDKISHFIELNQVGIQTSTSSIYIHTDPVSNNASDVNATVRTMIDFLVNSSHSLSNVTVTPVARGSTLPPASFQSFLKNDLNIPGIVITDHEKSYTNAYYNSMNDGRLMDDDANTASSYIEKTVTLVASLINNILGGPQSSVILPKENRVRELLDCYLDLKNCSLFIETSSRRSDEKMEINPNFYVGVVGSGNIVRAFTTQLMAYLVGETVINATHDQCVSPADNSIFSYRWMVGNESSSGTCVKSTVSVSPARSMAFELEDYDLDSGLYPSWTESVWDTFSLRIFLKPSFQQEVVTLCAGILVLMLSFSLVWLISDNSNILFANGANVVTNSVAC